MVLTMLTIEEVVMFLQAGRFKALIVIVYRAELFWAILTAGRYGKGGRIWQIVSARASLYHNFCRTLALNSYRKTSKVE